MSAGRVLFVGCGPGAEDLLTLRAVRALEQADVVIWNPQVLDRQALATHTRPDADVLQWPPATQDEILAAYARALTEELCVVRLKGGDPTLCGRMQADLEALGERGIDYEIIPGVSALSAAAARIGREVVTPQSALLVCDAAGLEGGPGGASTIAAYNAGREPQALQAALLERGLAPDTQCTVAIEVSRRDETLVACALQELAETVQDMGRGVLTLVLADACPSGSTED